MSKSGLTIDDLSEDEVIALKNQVDGAFLNPKGYGVGKQILGDEKKPLSDKQQYVFDNEIKPTLLEKCATCVSKVPAGVDYCPTCEIEYGNN